MATFDGAIAAFTANLPLAVAYSGGADSSALLHACARKWPGRIRAVHVHHGLQAAADSFEHHCVEACEQLGVPLVVRRVDARHAAGQSPEDAARRIRYDTLRSVLQQEWGGAVKDIAKLNSLFPETVREGRTCSEVEADLRHLARYYEQERNDVDPAWDAIYDHVLLGAATPGRSSRVGPGRVSAALPWTGP